MNIKNFLKRHFFYRQHPDSALRYLPIVDILKKIKLDKLKILEVGSGSYGIAPYLKKSVTGVDLEFNEPRYPLLQQVKGTALRLPFPDHSFEVVILSDVLEHLPKNSRVIALKEAARVAQKMLIVSGPFGKEAFKQDQQLAAASLKQTGQTHSFFQDHLHFGLPEIKDIKKILYHVSKKVSISVLGPFTNLGLRKILMLLFISKHRLVYYLYLKGLMPVIPILRLFNKPPGYRYIIQATFD